MQQFAVFELVVLVQADPGRFGQAAAPFHQMEIRETVIGLAAEIVAITPTLRGGLDRDGHTVNRAKGDKDFLAFFAVVKLEMAVEKEGAGRHSWRKCATNA